jgi:dihydroorotate dehydrogenase (fumarate)
MFQGKEFPVSGHEELGPAGFSRVKASLGATSGIHGPEDVVKLLLMVGANVTMLCSTLMRNGVTHLTYLEGGLRDWMEQHGWESVRQMQGSMSQVHCPEPVGV